MRRLALLLALAACHHPHAAPAPDPLANTVPGPTIDRRVADDVRFIVGGSFSVDEIGPGAFDKLVRRVKADPAVYLDALADLGASSPPDRLAAIYPDALLTLTRPMAPKRTAEVSSALIQRYTDARAALDDERLGMRIATMRVILEEASR